MTETAGNKFGRMDASPSFSAADRLSSVFSGATPELDLENSFGLKSIRDVGELYHGILSLSTEGGVFALRLSFPLCEQQFTAEN